MKTLFAILLLAAIGLPAFAQDSTIKTIPVYAINAVPVTGTNEVQTITITGTAITGGTFTLTATNGRTSSGIVWSSTSATILANVDAALEAMAVVGANGVNTTAGTLSSGTGTILLTFVGKNAHTDMPAFSANSSLTTSSGTNTVVVTTTTAGYTGTFREALPGTLLIDTLTPGLYQNASPTLLSSTWTGITVP